jgi:low affinity Fe/Cu permease
MSVVSRVMDGLAKYWKFPALVSIVVGWVASGPLFGFSAEWQMLVNSFTTIMTLLVVFVIQGTQERAIQSIHLKLDAILQSMGDAQGMVSLHEFSDSNLMRIEDAFRRTRGRPNVQEIVKAIEAKSKTAPTSSGTN